MSITSIKFIVFVLFNVGVYHLCNDILKKILLIIIGIVFYTSFNLYGTIYLIFISLWCYFISKKITKNKMIFLNILILSTLVFFKTSTYLEIIGISFISFKIMSYVVDKYNGKIKNENLIDYFCYVSFFPVITAGPIIRYNDFVYKTDISYSDIKSGFILFMMGLFEKMVIVLRINEIVSSIYSIKELSSSYYFLAVIFYSFQIYFDFDAYSNMAIGISKMFGYDLKPNFNTPYLARNFSDFYRRWHISLSSWFKDYVYIPLGGNRKGKINKYANILIVSLLSGLWHGFSFSCLIWGLLHGVFQIINDKMRINNFMGVITTFLLVTFSWIFFRNGIDVALFVLKKLFELNFTKIDTNILNINPMDFNITVIFLFGMIILDFFRNKYNVLMWLNKRNIFVRWFIYILLVFCFMIFGKYGINYSASDFIYQTF
ncbi:MAG: hypothetical protein MR601_04920 [Erysipelotrichaceae bacterium]|nr:hypothetical protein [Erysipelotrichaceae bacterium]